MRLAHTVEQVRAAEAALMATLPEGTLMGRAAYALAVAIIRLLAKTPIDDREAGASLARQGGFGAGDTPSALRGRSGYGRRVVLLVGPGDNGGDALYAGALLARRGVHVAALRLADQVHEAGLRTLLSAGGRVLDLDELAGERWEVAVDGIVGIGGRPGLRDNAVAALAALAEVPMVAVDVPSGVDVDTGELAGPHVRADLTVTFGTHKVAHFAAPAAEACGDVQLVDIGLDLELFAPTIVVPDSGDLAALIPVPLAAAHKYSRGVVGVRAGSTRYPGAALLCVAGANAGLAGMVRYVGPDSVAQTVKRTHPEVVGPGQVQAWAVGSGTAEDASRTLAEALEDRVPVVIDADALARVRGPLSVPAVLTPHAGELAAMLGVDREVVEAEQFRRVQEAANRFRAVVLLKGPHTLIASPGNPVLAVSEGPAWLATAGAGDVLTGLIAALLAAGAQPLEAAAAGAWLHGRAATLAAAAGPITASMVAARLPATIATVLGPGLDGGS